MTAPATSPTKLFISYSHVDAEYLQRLQTFLKPLQRQAMVDPWSDTKIKIGQKWREEIEKALNDARIAILLVSPDFLASDFINDNELPPLLVAARDHGVRIMPVVVGHCQLDLYPDIKQFQAANDPKHPLCDLTRSEQDKVWLHLTTEIIEELKHP